jgi:predicted DNA repair protein MutK
LKPRLLPRLNFGGSWAVVVPFALLITALFPLAIGPFLSFRFRLWHYLAYTSMIAVELAYYLRRQE